MVCWVCCHLCAAAMVCNIILPTEVANWLTKDVLNLMYDSTQGPGAVTLYMQLRLQWLPLEAALQLLPGQLALQGISVLATAVHYYCHMRCCCYCRMQCYCCRCITGGNRPALGLA